MQRQDMKLTYEAPVVEFFPLTGALSVLVAFSADAELEDFEIFADGDDLDVI